MDKDGGFKGVYHHWDSYPDALGKTLFKLYHGHFKRDLTAMLAFLIDKHPAGWSTINGADLSLPAGYEDISAVTRDDPHGPRCYCHGTRSEEANVVTQNDASEIGCEFVYGFAMVDGRPLMAIMSSYCNPKGEHAGQKMIGMFGCGDPKAVWKPIKIVWLDEPAPDWENIDAEDEADAETVTSKN
jgi:hypothetical protein